MPKSTPGQQRCKKVLQAARLHRRSFLRKAASVSLAGAIAPGFVRKAFATSGELNVLMWSDYLPASFLDAFSDATGITVNHTGVGSNEEILAKMRATKGQGYDLCSPTNMRSPQWAQLELLQAFDESRMGNLNNVNPTMLRIGENDWNFSGDGPHWLPHIWGTEAIGWRSDLWSPNGVPSYGDIWTFPKAGAAMIRPHSGMLGAGLYLETTGELAPGDMRLAYKDEESMRPIWDKVTAFCIKNRSQIKFFWNDAETQKKALSEGEVMLGQTWDGPPLALKTQGEPVHYQAPKEGALAWIDGLAMPVGAQNLDEIYAFIDFAYRPSEAGAAIDDHGYNSAVLGADQFAGPTYKQNFREAYPGDALANLWPWPTEAQWYADLRTEYRNKFVSA